MSPTNALSVLGGRVLRIENQNVQVAKEFDQLTVRRGRPFHFVRWLGVRLVIRQVAERSTGTLNAKARTPAGMIQLRRSNMQIAEGDAFRAELLNPGKTAHFSQVDGKVR